ncbi:MAG TPA: hypothetical protein VN157_02235, partial [Caulobacter sp.]|nr:hypothetical protein [Caulobacter sp.]
MTALEGNGLIVGSLFAAGTTTRLDRLDWANVAETEGRSLIEEAWGRYVALLVSPRGHPVIVRDPSGSLPVYLHASNDHALATSDAGLAADLGLISAKIDWAFVAEELGFPGQRGQRTGISDLEELAPGEHAELVDGRWRPTALWSPWTFATRSRQQHDPEMAARRLFDAVKLSADGLSNGRTALTLELSGGLDSSITATALAGHPGVRAVNGATLGAE